ncbi:MAG: D-lyxose/D-mannose family sugar isomerase [Nitrospiraceae bacterium]|nr:D-lyxose/D-mannose family sugar isomerase [Nitrospiraceae bacterium]
MKRSQINALMAEASAFLESHHFHLPPWAFWKPGDWADQAMRCEEIIENMLGWDITDFGSGRFAECGLLLFTLRNGNTARRVRKTYAEKLLIVEENQETPLHFHWSKAEDIINRAGGNLVMEIYGSTESEDLSDKPISVQVDGIQRDVEPGGAVVLTPGESICLEPGVYHRFFAAPGKGKVLAGEVSQVNDDRTDNRFHGEVGRFPEIDEDEEPLHLLVTDYERYL